MMIELALFVCQEIGLHMGQPFAHFKDIFRIVIAMQAKLFHQASLDSVYQPGVART